MSYVEAADIKDHLRGLVVHEGGRADESPRTPWLKAYAYRHPSLIPRREWLYGGHFIRSFLTTLFAPGAGGKSILRLTECIAMATGRALLGVQPTSRLRVAYWNGEDPLEETERRVAAILLHFDIDPTELDGWFFWGTGRESSLIIVEQTRDGITVNRPDVDRVKDMVADLQIDVLVMDPFIKTHRVNENDNNAVDVAAVEWAGIANDCNISVDLVHHTTKAAIGREVRVEDGRGGGALLFAARSAQVLNTMSTEEAEAAQVPPKERRWYFRIDNGKANLAPPPENSSWYRFHSVSLGNGASAFDPGDSIGVVSSWSWPEGVQRPNPEAKGTAVRTGPLTLIAPAQTIMAAFGRLFDDGRTFPPPPVPGVKPGTKAVKIDDLQKMARKLGLVTEPMPPLEDKKAFERWQNSNRAAWKRGWEAIVKAKTMRFEDGFVWELRRRLIDDDMRVTSRYDDED